MQKWKEFYLANVVVVVSKLFPRFSAQFEQTFFSCTWKIALQLDPKTKFDKSKKCICERTSTPPRERPSYGGGGVKKVFRTFGFSWFWKEENDKRNIDINELVGQPILFCYVTKNNKTNFHNAYQSFWLVTGTYSRRCERINGTHQLWEDKLS